MKVDTRQSWGRVAWVVVALITGFGCGKKKADEEVEPSFTYTLSPDEANAELNALSSRILFDPGLSLRERRFLGFDFRQIRRLKPASQAVRFQGDTAPEAYRTLFGSTTATALDFVLQRIKVVAAREEGLSGDEMTGAVNISLGLWLSALMENLHQVKEIELAPGRRLRLDSTRAGVIMLGKAYRKLDTPVLRASTLIHEARHSDCPEGISKAAFDDLKAKLREAEAMKKTMTPAEFKTALGNCSFPHIECPKGHELEGRAACDVPQGWGAYAVEALYGYALFHDCENCSEEEKQDSLMTYGEMAGRVSDWAGVLTGNYGLPDMRHAGYQDH